MTEPADIVIRNGRLMAFAPVPAEATALAIRGDRIAAVGTEAEIAVLKGPATEEIDAAGGTIVPGFIEGHVHLFGGSAELDMLDLSGIRGSEALTAAVRARAAAEPDARCVIGVSADYFALGEGKTITRHDLDDILPERPFVMMAADHHTVWANTAALEAGGILQGGPAPGGEIVMGEDGLALGPLFEVGAFGHVWRLTPHGGRELIGYVTGDDPDPPATPAQRAADKDIIARGLAYAAAQGITTLHNMDGNRYQLELLSELDAEGRLACRVQVPLHLKPHHPLDRLDEAAEWARLWSGDRVWSGRVKMFMDGVMESYTAFMLHPYPAKPDSRGAALFEESAFNEICVRADTLGLQISVHAIGDAAVRRTLDGYRAARAANGARDHRHRIEHIESLDPADLPRFGREGVVASMQPLHSPLGRLFPAPPSDAYLREDQKRLAFAWRDLRDAGAHLMFSTDWPVAPLPVMRSIQAAVATATLDGPWGDQRQTLDEAVRAYTADAAWGEFSEASKGRLAAGFKADVAVLTDDIQVVASERLGEVSALATLCAGRVTHRG
ncbi:MAG: amidohydrolase [Pseudomonadota bacterium]